MACVQQKKQPLLEASRFDKLPSHWKSGATQTKHWPTQAGIESVQAAYPSGTLRERFYSRDFQSPDIFAKMGCTPTSKFDTRFTYV